MTVVTAARDEPFEEGKSQRPGLSLNESPYQDSSNAYNTPTEYMWSARDFLPLTDVDDTAPATRPRILARAAYGTATALDGEAREPPVLMLPARSGP